MRRQRGGTAVVLGALSPRTRNAQVEMYQGGDVDYLVATDAIGMGLNMNVDHVAFAGLRKFDGRNYRRLTVAEIAQIAGRAGRHLADGTFGPIAEVGPFEEEIVTAIDCAELHMLDPSAPSGAYLIDPDGPGGEAPITVHCDMETDGGGWTRIFVAHSDNYTATDLDYTVTDLSLRQSADEAMIAYVDGEEQVLDTPARFPMPAEWVAQSPMTYSKVDVAGMGVVPVSSS